MRPFNPTRARAHAQAWPRPLVPAGAIAQAVTHVTNLQADSDRLAALQPGARGQDLHRCWPAIAFRAAPCAAHLRAETIDQLVPLPSALRRPAGRAAVPAARALELA